MNPYFTTKLKKGLAPSCSQYSLIRKTRAFNFYFIARTNHILKKNNNKKNTTKKGRSTCEVGHNWKREICYQKK